MPKQKLGTIISDVVLPVKNESELRQLLRDIEREIDSDIDSDRAMFEVNRLIQRAKTQGLRW